MQVLLLDTFDSVRIPGASNELVARPRPMPEIVVQRKTCAASCAAPQNSLLAGQPPTLGHRPKVMQKVICRREHRQCTFRIALDVDSA